MNMTIKKFHFRKRITKSALAMTLAAGMLFGAVTIPSGTNLPITIGTQNVFADGPTTQDLLDNIKTLQDSVERLMPGEKGVFESLASAFQPLTSTLGIYNSATTVLKMMGLMKDPTSTALSNIQSSLSTLHDEIGSLNTKMHEMADKLTDIDIKMREENRDTITNQMIDRYQAFKSNYIEPLQGYLKEYADFINSGFKSWYNNADKGNIYICFTDRKDTGLTQVYYYEDPDETDPADIPEQSVEGFAIDKESSIKLSSESVSNAMKNAGKWNVDNYRDVIISHLTAEILSQADAGTLTAGKTFYDSWKKMTSEEKAAKASETAEEAYNALSSDISRKQMNANLQFTTNLYNKFMDYCSNLSQANSPLSAELKALYLTHGFEGEIREQIYDIIDSTIVATGNFASMTMTVLQQNDCQSKKLTENAFQSWTNATDYLKNMRVNAVTGYDNYCYVTNTVVTAKVRNLTFENSIQSEAISVLLDKTRYIAENAKESDLLMDGDVLVGSVETTMLYHLFQSTPDAEKSAFETYLRDNDTGYDTSYHKIVTDCDKWQNFNPEEKITMKYVQGATSGGTDYWGTSATDVVVNDGTVENEYFTYCRKLTGDLFVISDGNYRSDQILGASAIFTEAHARWLKDEMYLFGTADSCNHINAKRTSGDTTLNYDTCRYSSSYIVLTQSAPVRTDENDITDPIAAFDYVQVTAPTDDLTPAVQNEYTFADNNSADEKVLPEDEAAPEESGPDETAAEGTESEEGAAAENNQKETTDDSDTPTESEEPAVPYDNTADTENVQQGAEEGLN